MRPGSMRASPAVLRVGIDYGNYNQHGHCNQSTYSANFGCAAEGEAFLDLCGNRRGGIAQTLFTDVGSTYKLSFLWVPQFLTLSDDSVSRVSLVVCSRRAS